MHPGKIAGGVLVLLGCVFRAISLAYFGARAKIVADTPEDRRQFAARRQRALVLDAAFVAIGFYLILTE